jgi:hypothetical protein
MSRRLSFPRFLVFLIVFAGGMVCGKLVSSAPAGGHEAAHGGVLNVIGNEVGHAELRLTGDLVELWFVGGGNDTNRAVPIQADTVKLTVEKDLVLEAAPLVLAGEKKGTCSHYTARAEWLSAMGDFTAHGRVLFKGQEFDLFLRYPEGYHPHHGHGHAHQHD